MSDYSDILNRKKTGDKLGDAFSKQADSMRPMNVGQRREQALLRGLGVGFSYDSEREDKLAELEEQYKQLDSFERELKMSVGKSQKIKADNENFFLTNRNDLATMNTFLANGDFEAVDVMAPTLIENYKKITGRNIGEYSYSSNGKIYMEDKQGNVKGQYIADILQGVIPQEEQMNFPELLTYNSKAAVANKLEEQRLKNEQIKAAIEASRASVVSSKAHAELYKSQAEKARNDVKNPPMNDQQKILFKADVDSNKEYIKDVGKKIISDKVLVKTLNETEEMLVEAAKKGQVGSDLIAQARRKWGKYISGNNKEMTIVDMAKAAYFARVKEAGGSNPSTTEFLTALETIPNTDKNLLASLNILRKDKINALNNIYRFNNIEKNLRTNNYQGSPYDENVVNFNEDEFNNYVKENSSKKTIKVSKINKNTGKKEIIEIPLEDYEEVYNDGYSFVGK
jgi:hypothetical protein